MFWLCAFPFAGSLLPVPRVVARPESQNDGPEKSRVDIVGNHHLGNEIRRHRTDPSSGMPLRDEIINLRNSARIPVRVFVHDFSPLPTKSFNIPRNHRPWRDNY